MVGRDKNCSYSIYFEFNYFRQLRRVERRQKNILSKIYKEYLGEVEEAAREGRKDMAEGHEDLEKKWESGL